MQTKSKTMDKSKLVPKKQFNVGETVTWKSQANSYWTKKTGRIVAVLRPGVNYAGFQNLPAAFFEVVLRRIGLTRDEARDRAREIASKMYAIASPVYSLYNLKFDPFIGMTRDEYHYLVEVDGSPYPTLYHPLTKNLKKNTNN